MRGEIRIISSVVVLCTAIFRVVAEAEPAEHCPGCPSKGCDTLGMCCMVSEIAKDGNSTTVCKVPGVGGKCADSGILCSRVSI